MLRDFLSFFRLCVCHYVFNFYLGESGPWNHGDIDRTAKGCCFSITLWITSLGGNAYFERHHSRTHCVCLGVLMVLPRLHGGVETLTFSIVNIVADKHLLRLILSLLTPTMADNNQCHMIGSYLPMGTIKARMMSCPSVTQHILGCLMCTAFSFHLCIVPYFC